ncbi:MAG: cyclic nucleotide-binding domain-containing protein [Rhodospirillales bacterium]
MNKMKVSEVIKGVYWLEIPEADLFILCGCPEDVTKHLMRLNLIVPTERDGVIFETGPNAILLSDVALQNGKFCNLAEFPVLQMLYKQGMIIPNHPNNSEIKPLLIGAKDQIDSQMQYIYRGNYGLVSEEEIIATGETPERAKMIMRMKLKFAFGKILSSDELLDYTVVGEETVEVRNSVFVTRTRTNVFEFSYENEKVTIDLTIKRGRNDRSAYPLGFQSIPRDYFSVIHSGQGDGWDINRPCMASIVMYQGKIYLIDAGPNIAYSLTVLGISINEIEGIFHTHCHDDHFAGITSLIRTDKRIKYYATPLVRATVFKKLSALLSMDEDQISNFFEIKDLEFDTWNDLGGLEVRPFLSPHPVETTAFIFRVFWESQYLTYAHMADIVSLSVLENMITSDDDAPGISQEVFDSTKEQYLAEVDLKKIDIGGGMIHGEVEDFADDQSDKIVLAHRSEPLTNKQKEIGSSAPFGVVDTLVPDDSGNLRRFAFQYLNMYFQNLDRHYLRTLLNNPIVEFSPGSIILRKGRTPENIYLIITGTVEKIRSDDNVYNIISAGGLIGEYTGIHGLPSKSAYRTVNYARALRITAPAYKALIKKNNLSALINERAKNREILERSWLFGESVSPPILNKIADVMTLRSYGKNKDLTDLSTDAIFIVGSGSLEQIQDHHVSATINPRNFFGEEQVLFGETNRFKYRTAEPSQIYEIPKQVINEVPIIMWKMLESYEFRNLEK